MTREQLADRLGELLRPVIDRYADQKSALALRAEAEIHKIEQLKTTLGADSPAVAKLQEAVEALDYNGASNRKMRMEEASFALVHAANSLGLKIQLRSAGKGRGRPAGSTGGAKRTRMTRAAIADAAAQILKTLPPKNTGDDNCKAKGDIAEDTGLPQSAVDSALLRLKREGKAESNGRRGAGGGWRRSG
ncbi:MAG: hypothetical protein AAF288_10330 [Planctomycetota bacterium]